MEPLALPAFRDGLAVLKPYNDLQRIDRIAIGLSGLCLVHCLSVPLALLLAPALSVWLDATETQIHWLLLGLALPISGIALYRGYRRQANMLTVILGCTGFLLMLLGVTHALGEALEITLTVIGITLVMFAHIRNLHVGHEHAVDEP